MCVFMCNKVRVLVIDSIAFHFRRDFEDMALRTRLLTGLAQDLLEIAEKYDVAVSQMLYRATFLQRGGGGCG